MLLNIRALTLQLLILLPCLCSGQQTGSSLNPFLPKVEDFSSHWWRHGYPGALKHELWEKSIRTGSYGMIFNTKALSIPHLGSVDESSALGSLPPANLDLTVAVNGKTYRSAGSKDPTRFTGPRLIEGGVFLQRFDITDLIFKADDGSELNQESRLECSAWSDRLGFKLAMRPGVLPIPEGEKSFGIVDGGFGLTPTTRFDISAEEFTMPEQFTFSLWVFVPLEFALKNRSPWLVCSHGNEASDGHFGISLDRDAKPSASLNIGGGKCFTIPASKGQLRFNQWNHLAISYDGDLFKLYANGGLAGETKVGLPRNATPGPIAIGDRQDMRNRANHAYRFFGVIDEIQAHNRALQHGEIRELARPHVPRQEKLAPIKQWTFRPDGKKSMSLLSEQWTSASMNLSLTSGEKKFDASWQLPAGTTWTAPDWNSVSVAFNPATSQPAPGPSSLTVQASELPGNTPCPVTFDQDTGWFMVDLNNGVPTPPAGQQNPTNDAMERVKLRIENSGPTERNVRLMFDKKGFKQRIGSTITGVSAILCDKDGNPTGAPVQLSKNWHNHPQAGVYSGQWFHGITQLRLPAGKSIDLEFRLVYGHWGKLPAASHAQLSLIGWAGNNLWEESALGSWGESICYDPEQAQASCTITDVRPMMVKGSNNSQWNWTLNHGGGDFFRFFNTAGDRIPHSNVRAVTQMSGPCLTAARYTGEIPDTGMHFSEIVSIHRTDDLVTGTFRIRMDATKAVDFSRFVIFQIGADSYTSPAEQKIAVGNKSGLIKAWDAQWGGNEYKGGPIELSGTAPWVSLYDPVVPEGETGSRVNRAIIVRNWKARLGGKDAPLFVAEHGLTTRWKNTSTMDIVPPPGVNRLEAGDFVEATIELALIPRDADQYYGPNQELRAALQANPNSWKLALRQAAEGDLKITPIHGSHTGTYPGVFFAAGNNRAEFTLEGGVGFVPVTITNLNSHDGHTLLIDGTPLDQSVHGNDFWQTNFNPKSRTWSRTYNIPAQGGIKRTISLTPKTP